MDPNDRERERLNREITQNASRLLDRFRRPILEGCGYTVNMTQPPVYTVARITPVLDRPDLPRGTFRVHMVAELTLLCANNIPVDELSLCAMSAAIQQRLAGGGETTPPPAEPPPGPRLVVTDAPDANTDSPNPAPPAPETPDAT